MSCLRHGRHTNGEGWKLEGPNFKVLQVESTGLLLWLFYGVSGSSIVPQERAGHRADSTRCPHCRNAVETLYHRFWECPRWQGVRAAAWGLPAGVFPEWFSELPPLLLLTGIAPAGERLRAWWMQRPYGPPQGGPPLSGQFFWTDGSCVDPKDPWLARAAWSIVGEDGVTSVGGVWGRQTAQRVEVTALHEALRRTGDPIEVVSDNQYVVNTFHAVVGGGPLCPRNTETCGQK